MQYSPKLKKAIAEIKDILEKYDIAGIVALHTPGYGEIMQSITPSYSCVKFEAGDIRVRALSSELGIKQRNRMILDTANMFRILANNAAQIAVTMIQCSDRIDEAIGIDHEPGNLSSHEEQNN